MTRVLRSPGHAVVVAVCLAPRSQRQFLETEPSKALCHRHAPRRPGSISSIAMAELIYGARLRDHNPSEVE